MHSFRVMLRRRQILDLEALTGGDFGVAPGCLRTELRHRPGPRRDDLPADLDELVIPGLQHVLATLAGGDSFVQAVALLQHPAEIRQGPGVYRLDLDESLVHKPSA